MKLWVEKKINVYGHGAFLQEVIYIILYIAAPSAPPYPTRALSLAQINKIFFLNDNWYNNAIQQHSHKFLMVSDSSVLFF